MNAGNYLVDGDNGTEFMSPYYDTNAEVKAQCNSCKVFFSEEELIDLGGWDNFHCAECHEENN